jgi:two-component system, OmpR family, response regulator
MRILIIEDDQNIGESLKSSLESELYCVDLINDGQEGVYAARRNSYDLLIVDSVLPGKLGPDICRELRSAGKTMPILMLTVRSEVADKVEALNAGADDYLTKPFSFEELLARVKALLRRPVAMLNDILVSDGLSLDTARNIVKRDGSEVYLTSKEYQLLEYLLRNKGFVVSRGMIIEHVWDSEGDLFSNTIETHILNLRKKIERPGSQKLIQTVPGRGYKIL